MSTVWPTYLPEKPLLVGHRESLISGVVRTKMESGRARQRRVTDPGPQRLTLNWAMTGNQLKVFKAWLAEIVSWVDFFEFDLPDSETTVRSVLARFTDRNISYTYVTPIPPETALFFTGVGSHVIFTGNADHLVFGGGETATVLLGEDPLFFTGAEEPLFFIGDDDAVVFSGDDDAELFEAGEHVIFTGDPDHVIFHRQVEVEVSLLNDDLWQVVGDLEIIDEA